ncbi:hypothetical protein ACHQM5_021035 [Ranunculus cassubicifolius]
MLKSLALAGKQVLPSSIHHHHVVPAFVKRFSSMDTGIHFNPADLEINRKDATEDPDRLEKFMKETPVPAYGRMGLIRTRCHPSEDRFRDKLMGFYGCFHEDRPKKHTSLRRPPYTSPGMPPYTSPRWPPYKETFDGLEQDEDE